MGEWLDFGPYNDDEDDYEEEAEASDFEPSRASAEGGVYVCSTCHREYKAETEETLHRTVVDITQRYPQLDLRRYAIARLTVRAHGSYVAVEDACRACWNREAWSRIQRAYGYQNRP